MRFFGPRPKQRHASLETDLIPITPLRVELDAACKSELTSSTAHCMPIDHSDQRDGSAGTSLLLKPSNLTMILICAHDESYPLGLTTGLTGCWDLPSHRAEANVAGRRRPRSRQPIVFQKITSTHALCSMDIVPPSLYGDPLLMPL